MTDAIDITTDQRQTLLSLLKKHLPNVTVWAYGSRVKWTARPDSDLDVVVFATPEQKDQVAHLKEAFDESDLPFRVDLFRWDEVPKSFHKNISAEKVVLQEKNTETVRMGNEWNSTTLGNVVELKRGYDLPKVSRLDGKVPIISSAGLSGSHSKAKVKGPGVVTGRYGTIGKVYLVAEDFWPLNTTLYVKDFKGNDVRFISYFLKQIDYQSCSDKAAVPGVNRNHLHMVSVRIPPLPEQRAIAHILGSLDDKIELNRQMNVTLEGMAEAIFKSWFIDFGPVLD
ncbi:MAG: restriction endonuclease subunit S [Planctomycetaceae bacterium]|nr:restriction endonuclease subunit S [Planctomycetaceae bacterium]